MKLYDSLSKQIVDLDLLNKTEINIYACGPTVYDYIHIGNARPLVLVDLISRILKYQGKKVNFLLNITDIDDKIIDKAIKSEKTEVEISSFFSEQFLIDYACLNLNLPSKILTVTESIPEFIKYIDVLVNNKMAYVVNGNVIFDISKFSKYGELSNNKIDNLISNQEIKNENFKLNNSDFVLWKNTDIGIKWDSKWSQGRPGWHLECAVFVDKYFKTDLDIHVGGVDLKFPHHENERGIFMAKNNSEISKIWIHNGIVNINNKKMSKSLSNSFYVKNFIEHYDSNTLKYFFYLKKYMQPLNIDDNILVFVQKELSKMYNLIAKFEENYDIRKLLKGEDTKIEAEQIFYAFMQELNNNLNTANALEILKLLIKKINIDLKQGKINYMLYEKFILALNILGFSFDILKYKYNVINGTVIKNKNNEQNKKNMLVNNKN